MALLDENKLAGRYKLLNAHGKSLSKAYSGDGGWDIFSAYNREVGPHETVRVETELAISIPEGYVGVVSDRSSMASKGIFTVGGIIDCGYTGQLFIQLYNSTEHYYYIAKGDKIAQILILPVPDISWEQVDDFKNTERGDKGFGSSN